MKQYVVYHRVSTKRQGESGLGLEAQQRDIDLFLSHYAGDHQVIETFVDVRSGKGSLSDRPTLKAAVELCKQTGAILLVAKVDRLSRDVETVAHIIKHINVIIACLPQADKFQIHLYAALAEQEREFISQRTKAALQAAKERGVKLGGIRDNIQTEGCIKAADDRAESLRPEFQEMRRNGYSVRAMAESLNARGIKTSRGSKFNMTTVQRMIVRLGI
ncbi:MAG TPA: recombinase family protein [Kurthia gibsonii]|uniref:recombinase family protein n=1 Tax=Aeromonas hydrophila TaxID=644 RepID=UPI000FD161D9|nr:recombinase family protein [Aeromonas hydrophila]AZU48393.1 resolvase [Aeromonas hydrophila]QBX71079.1 DNA invertase [Aeromonas hydrophila]HZG12312.1 recombinase family protein [Kurthia gibsonii]